MVPTSLILLILTVAFFPASFAYFWNWPKRRIVNVIFPVMAGDAALMIFTLVLSIADVQIAWLSWVLLAAAILMLTVAIRLCRRALAVVRARDRALAERMAGRH